MKIKGLNQKKRNAAIHRWKRRHEHECKRLEVRKVIRKFRQIRNRNRTKDTRLNQQRTVIDLPEIFDLHSNYEAVMNKMNQFRKEVDKPRPASHKLTINFNTIKHIDISSALILAADLDVCQIKYGKLKSHHKNWQPQIRALLNEMGLFKLLDMPPLQQKSHKKDTFFVKFLSARLGDGRKLQELRKRIEETLEESLSEHQQHNLFASLAEAALNTKQHAYNNSGNLKEYEKWWVTAAYSREGNRKKLTVALYDRGLTIPKTMLKQGAWEKLKEHLPPFIWSQDSHLIRIAMQVSHKGGSTRTRTMESHRGKGLKQLLELSTLGKNGKVLIISGKGLCYFTLKNNKLVSKPRKEVRNPMPGTLVEWQIYV